MRQSSMGIVLKTTRYRESSLILQVYTEKWGRIACMVSGVRKQGSKLPAAPLQPMMILYLQIYYRENKKIHRLSEYKMQYVYTSLLFDLQKTSMGFFVIELLLHVLSESQPHLELFHFVVQALQHLDVQPAYPNFPVFFMIQLPGYLGFRPQGTWSASHPHFSIREGLFTKAQVSDDQYDNKYMDAHSSQLLFNLLQSNWDTYHQVKTTIQERRKLLADLMKYYSFHLDTFRPFMNTIKILRKVL